MSPDDSSDVLLRPVYCKTWQFVSFYYLYVHLHMCLTLPDEHRLPKRGTPRQIVADRESNTFYYYDSTTTQNSKNVKCSYAVETFSNL